jgi:hypothetical protein
MRDEAGSAMTGRQRCASATRRSRPVLTGALAGALALGLGGCAGWNNATYGVADRIATTGANIGVPWGGMQPRMPEEGLTIARVTAGAVPPDQLQPQSGDVWPGPLPPRATLANPDAALRGIPDYDPALTRRDPSAEALPRSGPPQRGLPRASAPPPPSAFDRPDLARPIVPPPPPPAALRTPPRADGQIIHTPSGPVVTSGGTDRVQSFNTPGGGTGTAIRDGNTTTLIGPDGRVQVVPTPSR